MSSSVSILTIGNEITDGRIINTNASYLSQELKKSGYLPVTHLSCRDEIETILEALSFLAKNSTAIILSGGLGPTSDDQTRHALAKHMNETLELREEQLQHLKAWYRKKQRTFEEANRIQALFPPSAKTIENPTGTAAGLFLKDESETLLFALPGVPSELKRMFTHGVLPLLENELPPPPKETVRSVRLFGLPESTVGRWITQLNIDKDIHVGYRAHFPELEVRLSTSAKETQIENEYKRVRDALGEEFIVTQNNDLFLPEVVTRLLSKQQKTVSVAESCTGGLLGKLLTDLGGSSSYFLGGALTYSNEAKEAILNVSHETLDNFGAVSEETAKEMAQGTRQLLRADIGLSLTGIAGPGGGSDEKPVGTFYVGIATESLCHASRCFFPGPRTAVRKFAAYTALDTVRRYLCGLRFIR